VAKALALGADAVSIGVGAMIALGDNAPEFDQQYREIGSAAGYYDDYQAGLDPSGISTQDPELAARFDPVKGGRRLANYLRVLTLEAQTLARACGKSHVHNLEPEDLVALTIEAAAMARVPLAGTNWIRAGTPASESYRLARPAHPQPPGPTSPAAASASSSSRSVLDVQEPAAERVGMPGCDAQHQLDESPAVCHSPAGRSWNPL
jgi:hypothetical protein